jgi:hypothetical protein
MFSTAGYNMRSADGFSGFFTQILIAFLLLSGAALL